MTVLELLSKWGLQSGPVLINALNWLVKNAPDLAPQAQAALDELNKALGPEALGNLAQVVVEELKDVGQGKTDGRFHPSDLG